ncbi:hypothetical protein O9993_20325 [Vibrio lentus]|nr:hypothetical protein [Vibrio lentus]
MNWARKFLTDNRQGPAPSQAKRFLRLVSRSGFAMKQLTSDEVSEEPTEEQRRKLKRSLIWRPSAKYQMRTPLLLQWANNGAVLSMVGGFNFVHNKFNRATHLFAKVGSGIKPFIYSAAIDKGSNAGIIDQRCAYQPMG